MDTLSDKSGSTSHDGTVLSYLKTYVGKLFVLLDAARKPANVVLLRESGDNYQSLYTGKAAEELVNVAPYLVQVSKDSRVLEKLATEGWGDAWGYCIVSHCSFDDLRAHLRKFLMVKLEDGRQVYFRFYDPRILPVFMESSTPDQLLAFFEKIERVLCPGAGVSGVKSFQPLNGHISSEDVSLVQRSAVVSNT